MVRTPRSFTLDGEDRWGLGVGSAGEAKGVLTLGRAGVCRVYGCGNDKLSELITELDFTIFGNSRGISEIAG